MGKASLIKPFEPPIDVVSLLGYPVAPVGGAEWSLSSKSIMLSDSNGEQFMGTV